MVPPAQTPRGLRPQRLASQADACGREFPFRFAPLKCGRNPWFPHKRPLLDGVWWGGGEKEIEDTPDFPGCFCFSAGVFRGLPRSCSLQARFPHKRPVAYGHKPACAGRCGREFPFRFAPLKCGREPTVPPNAPLPKCGGGVGEKEIESTPDFPGCFCFSAGVFRELPRSCSPQALFRQSIQAVCQGDYTAAQLSAWAGRAETITAKRLLACDTLVAEEKGCLLGFANLEPGGYLDCLYTAAES